MISNASPLIFLSKINQLFLLKKLFGYILITKDIKEEILVESKPGTVDIINAIREEWIKIVEVKKSLPIGIKGGESSVINLARERKDKLITDDAIAIKVAQALNIDTIRTTTIIFMAVGKNIINKKQAISLINKLNDTGYYISPRYYSAILTKFSS